MAEILGVGVGVSKALVCTEYEHIKNFKKEEILPSHLNVASQTVVKNSDNV